MLPSVSSKKYMSQDELEELEEVEELGGERPELFRFRVRFF